MFVCPPATQKQHTAPKRIPTLLLQSLQNRNVASDAAAEKQLVALLSIPLDTYDTVTVLSLKSYPDVMSLLSPVTRRVSAPACPCWVMDVLLCKPAIQPCGRAALLHLVPGQPHVHARWASTPPSRCWWLVTIINSAG